MITLSLNKKEVDELTAASRILGLKGKIFSDFGTADICRVIMESYPPVKEVPVAEQAPESLMAHYLEDVSQELAAYEQNKKHREAWRTYVCAILTSSRERTVQGASEFADKMAELEEQKFGGKP